MLGSALALAAASRPDPPENRRAAAPFPATASREAVRESVQDSLDLELVLPPRVRAGERVPVTMRLRNRTGRALDLYLRGRDVTFDVVVTHAGGTVVWRRLEGEIIPAIVQLRTLAPAEQLEFGTEWDQRGGTGRTVDTGDYSARGMLLIEGGQLETPPVPLRIVDR